MSDLPVDPWAAILVGHQWPGSSALATLSAAASSRHSVGAAFHGYADALRSVSDTVLSDQHGATAESIRASFRTGEGHARGIADRNTAKKAALDRAHRCVSELRAALAEIADRGTRQIHSIQDGSESAAVKIAAIVAVVQAAQTDADTRAALCLQDVYGSIQTVLDTCGHDSSARQFADTHGVGQRALHSAPHPDGVHERVQEMVDEHSSTDLDR